MAPNSSDQGEGDKTRAGTAPPPRVKRSPEAPDKEQQASGETPAAAPAPTADRTQAAGAPPPLPKAPPPGTGEGTSRSVAPPPKAPAVPTAPEQVSAESPPQPLPAVTEPARAEAEEEGTVILTRSVRPTATVQRVQPRGRSEIIPLERTTYLIGRSHKCDLQLYSPAASREHAQLTRREAAWYVQPLGGKTVIADGVTVRGEQRLTHKMRLQLGGDELVFFDETAALPAEDRLGEPVRKYRLARVVVAVAVVAAIAVAAWWVFSSASRLP